MDNLSLKALMEEADSLLKSLEPGRPIIPFAVRRGVSVLTRQKRAADLDAKMARLEELLDYTIRKLEEEEEEKEKTDCEC